jgi:hypothetical protein
MAASRAVVPWLITASVLLGSRLAHVTKKPSGQLLDSECDTAYPAEHCSEHLPILRKKPGPGSSRIDGCVCYPGLGSLHCAGNSLGCFDSKKYSFLACSDEHALVVPQALPHPPQPVGPPARSTEKIVGSIPNGLALFQHRLFLGRQFTSRPRPELYHQLTQAAVSHFAPWTLWGGVEGDFVGRVLGESEHSAGDIGMVVTNHPSLPS